MNASRASKLAFVSALCLAFAPGLIAQEPWAKIPIPPLPAFHPQEPKRIALPNGMVIFLQEDHELPTIDGVARVRGGSRSEPDAKAGLVSLYSEVWRTRGTQTQNGDQPDDYFVKHPPQVETRANEGST